MSFPRYVEASSQTFHVEVREASFFFLLSLCIKFNQETFVFPISNLHCPQIDWDLAWLVRTEKPSHLILAQTIQYKSELKWKQKLGASLLMPEHHFKGPGPQADQNNDNDTFVTGLISPLPRQPGMMMTRVGLAGVDGLKYFKEERGEGGEEEVAFCVFLATSSLSLCLSAQPPTVVSKMEAQLEYVHIAYTFLHIWRRFECSVGDY